MQRYGNWSADGERLAGNAGRLDVRQHGSVEGGLEQFEPVMAGDEQVRDEVHAVIELDPVGRGTADAVAVAPVEAGQQRGQISDDDGLHFRWCEGLARNGGHVVVQQQRSVGRLDCAEKLRHQITPEITCGIDKGIERRGDRRRKPGECPALRHQALSVEGSALVDPHVHAAGDGSLEMMLLVCAELQRAAQDELAPRGRGRLFHGVAPERESGAEAIDAFERGSPTHSSSTRARAEA